MELDAIKYGIASVGTGVTVVLTMYRVFVPRNEAREYRKSIEDFKNSTNTTIKDNEIRGSKRMDNIEFALSKAITRETLDDVMGPIKGDLSDIKRLLMEQSRGK